MGGMSFMGFIFIRGRALVREANLVLELAEDGKGVGGEGWGVTGLDSPQTFSSSKSSEWMPNTFQTHRVLIQ